MEMYFTDDQGGRYFRRIQLGLRFLAHGARTQTICQWTRATPDQLATLRRRCKFSPDERLRGPSPSSFQTFFRSARCRNQAALFLCICRIVGVRPLLEFEQLVLLLTGAVEAGRIELTGCSSCEIAVLLDKLMKDPDVCLRCRRLSARRPPRGRPDS